MKVWGDKTLITRCVIARKASLLMCSDYLVSLSDKACFFFLYLSVSEVQKYVFKSNNSMPLNAMQTCLVVKQLKLSKE